jgi:hypothetical protein
MGERRAGRFRIGRQRRSVEAAEPEVPCIPCGQQADLQPFALNEANPIDDDLVPVLVADVAHAITGGEVVLFDPVRSTSTLLNSSAAYVWASIDGEATVSTIIDDLATETGADRSIIDADVRETIARLIHGRIVVDPASSNGDQDPDASTDAATDALRVAREERRARLVQAGLDRRAWCLEDTRRCAGAPVAIRTDDDELASLLAPALALLPPSDAPTSDAPSTTVSIVQRTGGPGRRLRIMRGTSHHAFASSATEALDTVFTLLNDIAINETSGRLVFHAGAVQRDGAIVVIAAPSGHGKSTLTAALVQRGFGYLSDEVVAIDPELLDVLPYPKPFDLDRDAAALLGIEAPRTDGVKGKVSVGQLGAVANGAARVAMLVLLDDPANPTPGPTTPAEQLIELLANAFASTFDPATAPPQPLEALEALAQRVSIVHLGRGAIEDACRAVDEHLRSIDLAAHR